MAAASAWGCRPSSVWDREEPKFYALPQPKLPDKPGEKPPASIYKAPEQGA